MHQNKMRAALRQNVWRIPYAVPSHLCCVSVVAVETLQYSPNLIIHFLSSGVCLMLVVWPESRVVFLSFANRARLYHQRITHQQRAQLPPPSNKHLAWISYITLYLSHTESNQWLIAIIIISHVTILQARHLIGLYAHTAHDKIVSENEQKERKKRSVFALNANLRCKRI